MQNTGELHPINDDLPRHNRRVFAERLHWPDGALEACNRIADACPDWLPSWEEGSTIKGFERPPGFYASRKGRRWNEPAAYGEDPTALVLAISTWPWGDGLGGIASWNPPPVTRPARIPGQRCYGSAGFEDGDCEYRWPHGEHPIGEAPAR